VIRTNGHNLAVIAKLNSVRGSLRERSPGVWQARLVDEASQGRIPLTNETCGCLLDRWTDHIEAGGRAPKTLSRAAVWLPPTPRNWGRMTCGS
jgi:hypothetical protein